MNRLPARPRSSGTPRRRVVDPGPPGSRPAEVRPCSRDALDVNVAEGRRCFSQQKRQIIHGSLFFEMWLRRARLLCRSKVTASLEAVKCEMCLILCGGLLDADKRTCGRVKTVISLLQSDTRASQHEKRNLSYSSGTISPSQGLMWCSLSVSFPSPSCRQPIETEVSMFSWRSDVIRKDSTWGQSLVDLLRYFKKSFPSTWLKKP